MYGRNAAKGWKMGRTSAIEVIDDMIITRPSRSSKTLAAKTRGDLMHCFIWSRSIWSVSFAFCFCSLCCCSSSSLVCACSMFIIIVSWIIILWFSLLLLLSSLNDCSLLSFTLLLLIILIKCLHVLYFLGTRNCVTCDRSIFL